MAGKSAGAVVTEYAGIQVQTSALSVNIPVGWGTFRCKCNLIWYGGFSAKAQKAASGKGGSTTTGYSYSADLIMAICEGPIDAITTVYVDAKTYVYGSTSGATNTGTTSALTQVGLSLSTGAIGQAAWAYLETHFPAQALGYSGLAITYASGYPLDSGASVPNHSYEVVRLASYGVAGTPDADPSLVVLDFLTNPRTGVPSWNGPNNVQSYGEALISASNLAQYQDYCLAAGLLVSPVIDSQRTASDFLTELLLATNSTCVWSEGMLKMIPYGDVALTANGKTYSPNVTPVYSLNDDDYLVEKSAVPLSIDIMDQSDAYNAVQLEYLDRTNQYNMAIALASDAANVAQYGARRKDPDTVHCICTPSVAALSAQLWLQRTLYVRGQYKFSLSWIFAVLEPGDIVELTDSGLGLSNYPVRIIQIDEDEQYGLDITAEDAQIGVASAPIYQLQPSNGFTVNQNVAPGNAADPVIFNAPLSLTGGALEVWVGTSGGPDWGGAQVWTSLDGANYQYSGTINGSARYGVTTTAFSVGSDPDTLNSVGVNLAVSGGELISASQAAADAAATLCMIDNELIAFETATLTGTNQYTLGGYIRRGMFGTTIATHAAGAPFVRIDGALFEYGYLSTQAETTVYVKFVSFNPYGYGLQDLSTVPAYEIVPAGVPAPGVEAWSASGASVGGETGAAPILTVTGAVDRPGVQSIIIDYQQIINSAPTYGPTQQTEFPASTTRLQINVGVAGVYDVRVRYRALGGAENAAVYLDLGAINVGVTLASALPNITGLATVYQAGITRLVWTPVEDYRNPDYEVRVGPTWASGVALGRTTDPVFTTNGDATYWIAAHYAIPNGGGDVYSANPSDVIISGSQLTANIVASYNEAATSWSGTLSNVTLSAGAVQLNAGASSGTYEIPASHRINIGRVAACNVLMDVAGHGLNLGENVLGFTDILSIADLLDGALGPLVSITPQIRLSQNGSTWGAWTNWSAGAYVAMAFDFQVVLATTDATVVPVMTGLIVAVDAPGRTDTYQITTSTSASTSVTYQVAGVNAAFNGGPSGSATPNVQFSILNAQAGDDVIVSSSSLSAITLSVYNAGARVARNVSLIVQGY